MGWRSLLGIDLSGKLKTWRRRYKGDWREFDHRTVWCGISEWYGGKFSASASAYCSDPSATGFDSRPIAWFWRSPNFQSRVEAEARLESEIRRATKTHPQTKFYRTRQCLVVEHGRVADRPLTIEEYCLAGQWHHAERVPSYRRCEACGHETEDAICPKCGEPVPS